MANKIGCSSNKTVLVDPNLFDGQSSSNNLSVAAEDLNISVQLETFKKGRTVLSASKDGLGTSESSKTLRVRFIEGEKVNGTHTLTTKYTDLTTVFDNSESRGDGQNLGITSIDVDFNSSYAPMVNITFVDLRGSAVFQNEQEISGKRTDNKYATFFQLPYPIFTLTIKGYYGKPVRYCLHMTKFNSRFNSTTGNFEITASFIGYTYAMLSDMLIGYLKAIPYTEIGAELYKTINEERARQGLLPVLTLGKLMIAISDVNTLVQKLAGDDPNTKIIDNANQKDVLLQTIESAISFNLGRPLEESIATKALDSYTYIIAPHQDAPVVNNAPIGSITSVANESTFVSNPNSDSLSRSMNSISSDGTSTGAKTDASKPPSNYFGTQKILSEYNSIVSESITKFNELGEPTIESKIFTDLTSLTYVGITKKMLNPSEDNHANDADLKSKLKNPMQTDSSQGFDELRIDLYDYLNQGDYSSIADDKLLDIYDVSSLVKKIEELRKKNQETIETATTDLAKILKIKIGSALGFEPTVRQITEVFTTAAEVFLTTLYRVSVEAESIGNTKRQKALSSIFLKQENSDIIDPAASKFYAWPDYREDNQRDGYIEKYLGAARLLKNPSDVTELNFITNLKKAFEDAAKAEQDAINNLTDKQTNWIPSNPLDTRLFTNASPYSRMQATTTDDIGVLMLIRAMTFLDYSNKGITGEEIDAQAKIEAAAVMNTIPDKLLLDAFKRLSIDKIIKSSGKVNGQPRSVLSLPLEGVGNYAGTFYYTYSYIFNDPSFQGDNLPMISSAPFDTYKVLPVSGDFKGTWYKTLFNDNSVATSGFQTLGLDLTATVASDFQGLVPKSKSQKFLTNYSPIRKYDTIGGVTLNANYKTYDGGTYVEIISANEYSSQAKDLVSDVDTKNVLLLSELSKEPLNVNIQAAGYNVYGGIYGVQEYVNLDWGIDELNSESPLPLMYAFYKNDLLNGLGRNRDVSGPTTSSNKSRSDYDLTYTTGIQKLIIDIPQSAWIKKIVYDDSGENRATHRDFGKNRVLFKAFKDGDKTLTYPFVNQVVMPLNDSIDDIDDQKVFSLFGSAWYYGQDKSSYSKYAKALLFLNTLPFNGNSFEANEILHLFDTRAGFIHAPRLWCAFIGGMIWRYDTTAPKIDTNGNIVEGGSGNVDPIQWVSGQTVGQTTVFAHQYAYAPTLGYFSKIPARDMFFRVINGKHNEYPQFGEETERDPSGLMFSLPNQVKDEFKKIFFDFVNGVDGYMTWDQVARNLEVWGGNSDSFINYMNTLRAGQTLDTKGNFQMTTSSVLGPLINVDKYIIIAPLFYPRTTKLPADFDDSDSHEYWTKHCMFLELKGGYSTNIAIQNLITALTDEVVITNTCWKIWQHGITDSNDNIPNMYEEITVSQDDLTRYVTTFLNEIQTNDIDAGDETKEADQEIFGTADENIIKLQLYRTCKNINDKWLGDVDNEGKIIFQCGARNSLDSSIAKHYRGDSASPKLIDSFRFVDRSFRDIGDDFYVNPLPVNDFLINNPNSTFYDAVTSLLSANNFDFIALPSFINYNDPKELNAMFEPMPNYEQALEEGICGPSFVCVYVGQSSKHLDFAGSEYSNDGFDVQCNDSGGMKTVLPKDFTNKENDHENKVAVFAVNYSQQNQNIFKDIILDQNEFTETAESLQIQDDISSKGSENNRTIAGQNMYNVYAVRSYKAEVEMMGNAMIQPMMYFQLNNIPMFHGAYMITHVRHSIKPNSMSTNFTGVRIRGPETPLITSVDLYKSLLSSIDLSLSSAGSSNVGAGTSIVNDSQFNQTIIPDASLASNPFADPVSNATITSAPGHRTMSGKVQKHKGVDLAVTYGSEVKAMYDGTIEKIKYNYNSDNGVGYGLYMVINHGVVGEEKILYKTVYGHLSEIPKDICDITDAATITKIKAGYNPSIKVTKGQKIGESGGTKGKRWLDTGKTLDLAGGSTGAHLHFELRIGTEADTATDVYKMTYVDPVAYLPLGQSPKYATGLQAKNDNNTITTIVTPSLSDREKLFDNSKNWL